jgi:hypothetical protein
MRGEAAEPSLAPLALASTCQVNARGSVLKVEMAILDNQSKGISIDE